MMPGVDVFGAPATCGAIIPDTGLEPVVNASVCGDGVNVPGSGAPVPSPGDGDRSEPGAGVAPRLEPAGPVLPTVCALA